MLSGPAPVPDRVPRSALRGWGVVSGLFFGVGADCPMLRGDSDDAAFAGHIDSIQAALLSECAHYRVESHSALTRRQSLGPSAGWLCCYLVEVSVSLPRQASLQPG